MEQSGLVCGCGTDGGQGGEVGLRSETWLVLSEMLMTMTTMTAQCDGTQVGA